MGEQVVYAVIHGCAVIIEQGQENKAGFKEKKGRE